MPVICPDPGKAQLVRLVDVVLLGPLMIAAAGNLPRAARVVLAIAGVLTISYNAHHYVRIARAAGANS